MGGFIVQKHLESASAPAAVLMPSAPPRTWFVRSMWAARLASVARGEVWRDAQRARASIRTWRWSARLCSVRERRNPSYRSASNGSSTRASEQ